MREKEPRTKRMQTTYMSEDDAQAHLDYPEKPPAPRGRNHCPRCGGHGGWNLRLNAYPMPPGRDDTPENRHRYTHFKAACSNCNGHGHIPEQQGNHVHVWETVRWEGHERRERCPECGKEQSIDTSG